MQYYGINAIDLWGEFKEFNCGEPIGPCINALIKEKGVNGGRSDFHIKQLRDQFYQDMTDRFIIVLTAVMDV